MVPIFIYIYIYTANMFIMMSIDILVSEHTTEPWVYVYIGYTSPTLRGPGSLVVKEHLWACMSALLVIIQPNYVGLISLYS